MNFPRLELTLYLFSIVIVCACVLVIIVSFLKFIFEIFVIDSYKIKKKIK